MWSKGGLRRATAALGTCLVVWMLLAYVVEHKSTPTRLQIQLRDNPSPGDDSANVLSSTETTVLPSEAASQSEAESQPETVSPSEGISPTEVESSPGPGTEITLSDTVSSSVVVPEISSLESISPSEAVPAILPTVAISPSEAISAISSSPEPLSSPESTSTTLPSEAVSSESALGISPSESALGISPSEAAPAISPSELESAALTLNTTSTGAVLEATTMTGQITASDHVGLHTPIEESIVPSATVPMEATESIHLNGYSPPFIFSPNSTAIEPMREDVTAIVSSTIDPAESEIIIVGTSVATPVYVMTALDGSSVIVVASDSLDFTRSNSLVEPVTSPLYDTVKLDSTASDVDEFSSSTVDTADPNPESSVPVQSSAIHGSRDLEMSSPNFADPSSTVSGAMDFAHTSAQPPMSDAPSSMFQDSATFIPVVAPSYSMVPHYSTLDAPSIASSAAAYEDLASSQPLPIESTSSVSDMVDHTQSGDSVISSTPVEIIAPPSSQAPQHVPTGDQGLSKLPADDKDSLSLGGTVAVGIIAAMVIIVALVAGAWYYNRNHMGNRRLKDYLDGGVRYQNYSNPGYTEDETLEMGRFPHQTLD